MTWIVFVSFVENLRAITITINIHEYLHIKKRKLKAWRWFEQWKPQIRTISSSLSVSPYFHTFPLFIRCAFDVRDTINAVTVVISSSEVWLLCYSIPSYSLYQFSIEIICVQHTNSELWYISDFIYIHRPSTAIDLSRMVNDSVSHCHVP